MASASRATARMSSADGLFAIRSSGSMRWSAAFAGSSEGNGLSVTAIRRRDMTWLHTRALSSQDLRVHAVRRRFAVEQRENIVDHDVGHLLAHFHHRAAEMRRGDHIGPREPPRRDLRLVLEHVETGTGNLALLECARAS